MFVAISHCFLPLRVTPGILDKRDGFRFCLSIFRPFSAQTSYKKSTRLRYSSMVSASTLTMAMTTDLLGAYRKVVYHPLNILRHLPGHVSVFWQYLYQRHTYENDKRFISEPYDLGNEFVIGYDDNDLRSLRQGIRAVLTQMKRGPSS